MMTYRAAMRGGWCPQCTFYKKSISSKLDIEDYQREAKEHGHPEGECLEPDIKRTDSNSPVPWIDNSKSCGHGVWMAPFSNVCRGEWCFICGHIRGGNKRRIHTLESLRLLIQKEGITHRSDFVKRFSGAYDSAYRNGWLDILFEGVPKENLEESTYLLSVLDG
jgi:hypothetical protein